MELRGHEHVVEVAEFAPLNAYSSIREMCGITVSRFTISHFSSLDLAGRVW